MTDQSRRYPPRQLDPSARARSFIARRSGAPVPGRSAASGTGVAMGGGMSSGGAGGVPGSAQTVTSLPVNANEVPAGTIYYVQGEDDEDSRAVMVIRKSDGTREYRDVIQGANAWPAAYVGQWGSAGLGNGQFGEMRGIAVNPANGDVIVASDDRLQVFTANGTYSATGATLGGGNGQVVTPAGMAWDSASRLFVADSGNHRIQYFTASGATLTYAGQFGSGPGSGAGQLNGPLGISIRRRGGVGFDFRDVLDTGNHRLSTWTSANVSSGESGSLGTGLQQYNLPTSRTDYRPSVWIVDRGNHRALLQPSGGQRSQVGGYGSSRGQLKDPWGVAVDSQGNAYITDTGNHRVQIFDRNGVLQGILGGYGAGNGQFDRPTGIAVTSEYVYVCDSGNRRVQQFANPAAGQSFLVGEASATWAPGTIPANGAAILALTVPGAAAGDYVQVSFTGTYDNNAFPVVWGFVAAADTVWAYITNNSSSASLTANSGTARARVSR